jgi:hypothetical protein
MSQNPAKESKDEETSTTTRLLTATETTMMWNAPSYQFFLILFYENLIREKYIDETVAWLEPRQPQGLGKTLLMSRYIYLYIPNIMQIQLIH